jgi:hypothetical protein
MATYSSQRHRKLMNESEYALHNASDSSSPRVLRIVNTILRDYRAYGMWESQHADLLLPVAEHRDKKRQIIALRNAEVQLVHRRAIFDYVRLNGVRGDERRQFFRTIYRTLDYHSAVLAEHRQYLLAVSSHVSTDHLIDIMNDPRSKSLSRQYETLYRPYFEMNCYVAGMGDSKCTELARSTMQNTRDQLQQMRQRIASDSPASSCASFDRQEPLARSGRFPVLNYLIG